MFDVSTVDVGYDMVVEKFKNTVDLSVMNTEEKIDALTDEFVLEGYKVIDPLVDVRVTGYVSKERIRGIADSLFLSELSE